MKDTINGDTINRKDKRLALYKYKDNCIVQNKNLTHSPHTLPLSSVVIAGVFLVCLVSHCNYLPLQVKERLRLECCCLGWVGMWVCVWQRKRGKCEWVSAVWLAVIVRVCVYSMIGIQCVSVWVCVCECTLIVPAVAAQSGAVGLIPRATLCQTYHWAKSNWALWKGSGNASHHSIFNPCF